MNNLPEVITETFDPIDYGFEWTDDWYNFDYVPAHTAARYARSKRVAELRKLGYEVKVSTDSKQLRTMGGIGSGHPQIEEVVSIYRLTAVLRDHLRSSVPVSTRVYFYNGWMWSYGKIVEAEVITKDNCHQHAASFQIGATAYIIQSEFNGNRYYDVPRHDFSY